MTIETSARGYAFTIDLDTESGDLTIAQDGVWAASGHWRGGRIHDCCAILGDIADEEQSLDIYDDLDEAISKALG